MRSLQRPIVNMKIPVNKGEVVFVIAASTSVIETIYWKVRKL